MCAQKLHTKDKVEEIYIIFCTSSAHASASLHRLYQQARAVNTRIVRANAYQKAERGAAPTNSTGALGAAILVNFSFPFSLSQFIYEYKYDGLSNLKKTTDPG